MRVGCYRRAKNHADFSNGWGMAEGRVMERGGREKGRDERVNVMFLFSRILQLKATLVCEMILDILMF